MSAIDTAEFRKLTLLAAGIDPTEIPPILDTAEWRRLLIVAIEQATAGGGGGAVSSVNTKTGAVVLNSADVNAVNLSAFLLSQGVSLTELETIPRSGSIVQTVNFTSASGFFTMFTPLVNMLISNLGFFISSTATGTSWQAGIYQWNDATLTATPLRLTPNDPSFLNSTAAGATEFRTRLLSSSVSLIAGTRYAIGVRGSAAFGSVLVGGLATVTGTAGTIVSSSPVMALMYEPSTLPTTPTVLSRSPLPAGRIYTKMT
jgi:hypothetical protein